MADDKEVGILKRFPKVFWVVQTFELMERGAYYTMLPIITVHAAFNLGVPTWLALILPVFMYPFQYGLPVFSGAYAEKFGYRRQMILAFSILVGAYLMLSYANSATTLILSVMLIGLGIGTYKPLVSATVAKCTPQKDRNAAYATYYLVVNLAAAVFPIIYVLIMSAGYMTEASYALVFRAATVFFILNLFTAILIFREVPRSGEVRTTRDVVNNISVAFKDKKFVVMVLLIGGFWALYSSFLGILPIVLLGFGLVPWWFTAMVLAIFNPLTIILAGPFLIKYMDKIESIRLLMGGVLIYCIGLLIIGMTLQWVFVIIGIVIASVGEFLVAPGYLAFVSKLAPKDQVSAYIGCNFLSTFLGITLGTLVFGLMANIVAIEMGRPFFMYGILVSYGLVLLVAFILYYRTWGQDIIARAKKIKEMEEGVDDDEVDEDYVEPIIFRVFEHRLSTTLPLVTIPFILIATFGMGTLEFENPFVQEGEGPAGEVVPLTASFSDSGSINENSQIAINIGFDKGDLSSYQELKRVDVQVTWDSGETSTLPLGVGTNEPDNMGFTLTAPMGDESETASSSSTGSGSLKFTPALDSKSSDYLGDWTLTLDCGDCGDSQGPGGRLSDADTSSGYSVTVSFVYDGVEEKEK